MWLKLVALEVDLGAAEMVGQPLGEIERRGSPDIVLEKGRKLGLEAGIGAGRLIGLLELENEGHQGLGHEATAKPAEMAMLVGARPEGWVRCIVSSESRLAGGFSWRGAPPQ